MDYERRGRTRAEKTLMVVSGSCLDRVVARSKAGHSPEAISSCCSECRLAHRALLTYLDEQKDVRFTQK